MEKVRCGPEYLHGWLQELTTKFRAPVAMGNLIRHARFKAGAMHQ